MPTLSRSLPICVALAFAAGAAATACKKPGGGSGGRPDVMNGENAEDMESSMRGDDARPNDWSGTVASVTYNTGEPTPSCTGASESNRIEAHRASFTLDRANKTLSGRWACAPAVKLGISDEDLKHLDATLLLVKFAKRGAADCDKDKVTGRWVVKREGSGDTTYVEDDAGCGADDVITNHQALSESVWGRLEAR